MSEHEFYTPESERTSITRVTPIRAFTTGATRDTDINKLVYESFLSPHVLERFAQYMHKHRTQSDGNLRDGDNWQKGMPRKVYMDSLVRHVMDLWLEWRRFRPAGGPDEAQMLELLCAVMFNVQGLMLELLMHRDVGTKTS